MEQRTLTSVPSNGTAAMEEPSRGSPKRETGGGNDNVAQGDARLSRSEARTSHGRPATGEAMKPSRWLRHALTIPLVVAGVWHGVEAGSRGAFLAAGAATLAWLVWPEAARFLAWRRRRRAEHTRRRYKRLLKHAERSLAKTERARRRADRRPGNERLARRAERLEARAARAVAQAKRARDRCAKLTGHHDTGSAITRAPSRMQRRASEPSGRPPERR